MSRVQVALNVSNIDQAVDFYRRLFHTEPAKRRPGYANFAIVDPPMKLVLIEGPANPAASITSASRSNPPVRWPPKPRGYATRASISRTRTR